MCGIIGYVGRKNNAVEMALRGLEQLEYRGYDSAGLAAQLSQRVFLKKSAAWKTSGVK
jgi:glucosamine--fructose-6-phosphate aminotransferase (isomerizing)